MKIKNLQTEDDGLYQCIATNGFGTTYVQIQLSVEGKIVVNKENLTKDFCIFIQVEFKSVKVLFRIHPFPAHL